MNDELRGIVMFLTDRGKANLQRDNRARKLYFIMRYPDKLKLVYAPIDCAMFYHRDVLHLLPYHLQYNWDERKEKTSGIELIAVCSVYHCIYDPFGKDFNFIGKRGESVLATTVHTSQSVHTMLTFYTKNDKGEMAFEETIEKDLELTPIGERMFPKYL